MQNRLASMIVIDVPVNRGVPPRELVTTLKEQGIWFEPLGFLFRDIPSQNHSCRTRLVAAQLIPVPTTGYEQYEEMDGLVRYVQDQQMTFADFYTLVALAEVCAPSLWQTCKQLMTFWPTANGGWIRCLFVATPAHSYKLVIHRAPFPRCPYPEKSWIVVSPAE